MKQYVIIARDGSPDSNRDDSALERRMINRPAHLLGAKTLKENGNLVVAGALLDDEGNMRGSVMIMQFESDEAFADWYSNEPYVTGNVWKDIEVKPFRVANI
jgi:uncharacterized protein